MIRLDNPINALEDLRSYMEMVGIPMHMHGAFERYLSHGISPGGFGYAVLTNNLSAAASRGDTLNKRILHIYGSFLWDLPQVIYGSKEIVDRWIERGGLVGYLQE